MPVPSSWVTGPMGQFIGGPTYDPPTYPVPQVGGGVGAPYGGSAQLFGGPPQEMPRKPLVGEIPRVRPGVAEARQKAQTIAQFRLMSAATPEFGVMSDDEIWTLLNTWADVARGAGKTYLSEEDKERAERIAAGLDPRATAGRQDTALDWAKFGMSQVGAQQDVAYRKAMLGETALSREALATYRGQTLGQNWAQMAQARALEEAQIAAANERARLQQQQRQREMAAQVGQAIAAMQAEVWRQGMPFTLPQGTTYAPGFERGGPVSGLYAMGGSQYTPTPMAVTNPPTAQEMERWVQDAMRRFGP